MKKILHWIKEHLPRWLNLDHQKPWYPSEKDNPPPDIGEQPFKDDPKPHSKWR